jgi:hypothetical protein
VIEVLDPLDVTATYTETSPRLELAATVTPELLPTNK